MSSKKSRAIRIEKHSNESNEHNISHIKSKHMKKRVLNALLVLALISIVGLSLYLVYTKTNGLSFVKKDDVVDDSTAAIVNGEVITMSELNAKFGRIPAQYQLMITKDKLLEQLVNEKLLLQQAKKERVSVTDQEVEDNIAQVLEGYNLDKAQLEADLSARNMTYKEFSDYYKDEMTINKLLNKTLVGLEVSEEKLKAYYDENIEQFSVPETVNASHVLICHTKSDRCESNLTKEEALSKIQDIQKELEDGAEFSDLAKDMSYCPSKEVGGNLGFFGKGQMTPAFEEAAFNLKEGEVSDIVETEFGYHLILLNEKRNASVVDFEAAKPEIEATVSSTKQQEFVTQYIDGLKNSSKIELLYKPEITEIPE
ncbi:MAG: peptidylprolyl isomerase [archaeon]